MTTEATERKEQALTVVEAGGALWLGDRDPAEVIQRASRAADELAKVVEAKELVLEISQGKNKKPSRHWFIEAWQTCGSMFGVTARTRSSEYIEVGGYVGYQATAEAYLVSTGQVIGIGDSQCLRDEPHWDTRPKYKWKKNSEVQKDDEVVYVNEKTKSSKVYVGEEPVPLFQLRSQAQTRAQSRALSSVLRWVAVLAGYSGTPAEDVTGQGAGGWSYDTSGDWNQDRKTPQPTKEKAGKDVHYRVTKTSIVLTGNTFPLNKDLKKVGGGRLQKDAEDHWFWEFKKGAKVWKEIQSVCEKAGVALVEAGQEPAATEEPAATQAAPPPEPSPKPEPKPAPAPASEQTVETQGRPVPTILYTPVPEHKCLKLSGDVDVIMDELVSRYGAKPQNGSMFIHQTWWVTFAEECELKGIKLKKVSEAKA
jgi:hypothetical protein